MAHRNMVTRSRGADVAIAGALLAIAGALLAIAVTGMVISGPVEFVSDMGLSLQDNQDLI